MQPEATDALRSDRFYREAWVHEHAIALLRDEAASKFVPGASRLSRVLERRFEPSGLIAV